jgi:ribonuclease BN (tRNA processing enzyme)
MQAPPDSSDRSLMKIKILGCSGGIGGKLRTTSMLLDDDVLIDAGTGVGDLSMAELGAIDHVFLTHAHLDHICSLPLLVDTVGGAREQPITVHAIPAVLDALRRHIFNNQIWPDFAVLPTTERPYLRYRPIHVGQATVLGSRQITALPAEHVVPAAGYHVQGACASLVFTGDTTSNEALWEAVNRIADLRYLIIETAFWEAERDLALASKHLCPSLLAEELGKLHGAPQVYVTHLKPGESELTMQQVQELAKPFQPRMLQQGQVFDL